MKAIILAGGLSTRLNGVPKAGLMLEGQTLLARTVDAAAHVLAVHGDARLPPARAGAGANAAIAVVGPAGNITAWLASSPNETTIVQEDPPYSGPAAGIAAGVAALSGEGYVLVLACDMPCAGELAHELSAALAQCAEGEGVMAVAEGRKQPLAAIYPLAGLRAAVNAARTAQRLHNASVFSLVASVKTKEFAVPARLTADIDTWADARAQGIAAGSAGMEGAQHGKSG